MKQLSKEQVEYAVGRLQKLVEIRKLSQMQLEQLSGVNQSTISKVLSGTHPSLEILKKLFQAVGLKVSDVLNETEALGHELLGYLATPLTGIARDERAEKELRNVVSKIKTVAAVPEFGDPRFDLYWPGDYTHPIKNSEFTPAQVYLTDRSRASTHDFLILFCGAPSFGVGQENEIATQAGIPAIRFMADGISRMMSGSFIKAIDITFRGSLTDGVHFDSEELHKALQEVRRLYFRHHALYKGMNGDAFGKRLRELVEDRIGDNKKFAEDLGISLSYLHALMEEPFTVSNPSIRLLKRMAVLFGERMGYLIGETEETDPVWLESNACWHAWVTKTRGLEGATAVLIRDEWRQQYHRNKVEKSVASFRDSNRPMRETDWDKTYKKRLREGGGSASQDLFL